MSVKYDGARMQEPFIVRFMVKKTGRVLKRGFWNLIEANRFAMKLKHSKRCELLSCPGDL